MSAEIDRFIMDPHKGLPMDSAREIVYYDQDGVVSPREDRAVAYSVRNPGTGTCSYHLLVHQGGHKAQRLFDPRDDERILRGSRSGQSHYGFRTVPESSFKHYLRYLRGGSINHLRLAERGETA